MFLDVFHTFSQVSSVFCHASYHSSFLTFLIIFCMHILHNSCFLVDSMQARAKIFSFFNFVLFYTSRVFNFGFFHTSHISYVFVFITIVTFLLTLLFCFMTLLDTCHVSFPTFILFHNISQHLLCLF